MAERIVFFGSGPVAAESLKLLAASFDIEAVITKPTTTRQMREAHTAAQQFTVENKQRLDELFDKQSFQSKVAVLTDFGIIVSRKVIDSFEFGIVNSHFSLLPEWRGADPITYSILSGQAETGVSLMLLTDKMDEGKIIGSGIQPITSDDTTSSLTHKLILLSDALLKELLPQYLIKNYAIDQLEAAGLSHGRSVISYSRKLVKSDGEIDWSKPASVIEREIRAYQPWPKSHTQFGDIDVIIIKARIASDEEAASDDKNILTIKCGSGALLIEDLQPVGKKPMATAAFLAGYRSRLPV
ncbi:MAG: methionyl-tRNA formyltransferase [bacterium]|nr:methionyl-tRNA formyltransferase [bacterium]